jgi:hypothetical protein
MEKLGKKHIPRVAAVMLLGSSLAACGSAVPDGEAEPAAELAKSPAEPGEEKIGKAKQALPSAWLGSCATWQQRELISFHQWLAGNVSYALETWDSSPNKLHGYFGVTSEWWWSDVIYDRLYDMNHRVQDYTFTYACNNEYVAECSDASVDVWVRPTQQDSTFHLCPTFWDHDNQGRLYSLVRELAQMAGAQRFQYESYDPVISALIYAGSWQGTAIKNADNYALFVMNPFAVQN